MGWEGPTRKGERAQETLSVVHSLVTWRELVIGVETRGARLSKLRWSWEGNLPEMTPNRISKTRFRDLDLVEQAYNPSTQEATVPTVKVKKQKQKSKQTSKQATEGKWPPEDRAQRWGCAWHTQGTRFSPQQKEGQNSESRIEFVLYSTKHKTWGYSQWKQSGELQMGSEITVGILEIGAGDPLDKRPWFVP